MWLKIVFTFISAAVLCSAQSGSAQTQAKSQPATQNQPAQSTAAAPDQAAAGEQTPPPRKPDAQGKQPAAADPVETKNPYIIGPLDVLVIKVWNNPNLSGPVDVQPDGMLSMQLIGQVKADGLTTRQLKETLTERLSGFLNNPEVDVQVARVNSKRYFVYGGVLRAGEFPLVQATTVMDALSIVGGFRDFANTKKIYVLRGTQKFNFNYKDVSQGKNLEQNILLQNGDRIFVPE
jgi:polysaccharide export outer membrane protein